MIILSKSSDITLSDGTQKTIVYNLITEDALYSIECYIAGASVANPMNYCLTHGFSGNEEFAICCLNKIVDGNVFPVHILDVISGYFPCHKF